MNSIRIATRTLCLLTVSAMVAAAAQPDEPLDRRLDKAADLARNDRAAEAAKAVRTCEDAIAAKDTTEEQRIRAFSILVQAYRSQKNLPLATRTALRLLESMPGSKAAEQASFLLQADLLKSQNKPDGVLEKVKQLIELQPDSFEGHQRLAEALLETAKNREAYEEAAKAAELNPKQEEIPERSLRTMLDAATRLSDHEKCASVLGRLLDPKAVARRDEYNNRDLRRKLVAAFVGLKKLDEARATAVAAEKADREEVQRQAWATIIGDCYLEEKNYDQALAAYEKVFTEYRTPEGWSPTQRKIVDTLAKKGAAADSLKAAHVLFDAAHEPHAIAEAARVVAGAFKTLDNNVARANAFIAFQRFGPAGEDGKGGIRDPFQEIGYPAYPEREKAFDELRKVAGDNAAAARLRALTCLYSGHPKDALKYFLDAFGRCLNEEVQLRADELVLIGARAARGHTVGLDEYYNYINYGPAGPDGKSGTPDDLPDPFAPLLK